MRAEQHLLRAFRALRQGWITACNLPAPYRVRVTVSLSRTQLPDPARATCRPCYFRTKQNQRAAHTAEPACFHDSEVFGNTPGSDPRWGSRVVAGGRQGQPGGLRAPGTGLSEPLGCGTGVWLDSLEDIACNQRSKTLFAPVEAHSHTPSPCVTRYRAPSHWALASVESRADLLPRAYRVA